MHDTSTMGDFQSFGDFNSNLQQLRERQRAPAQALGKRLPVEELHDQEVGTLLRAHIVEMADLRMIQRGNGTSFALETLLEFGIGGKMSRENLDGNGAIETRVFRAIDLAHAPCAEGRLDFIGTKFRARGEGHSCVQL